MNILIQLLVAIIVFFVARWLIAFTGIPNPLDLLLALLVAALAFWQSPGLFNRQ